MSDINTQITAETLARRMVRYAALRYDYRGADPRYLQALEDGTAAAAAVAIAKRYRRFGDQDHHCRAPLGGEHSVAARSAGGTLLRCYAEEAKERAFRRAHAERLQLRARRAPAGCGPAAGFGAGYLPAADRWDGLAAAAVD